MHVRLHLNLIGALNMKVILMAIGIVGLVGCGQIDREMAKITGNGSSTCYKGVEYVQFTSGASVAYNTDGTVRTCEN
jgi:hypothetical protein